MLTSSLYSHTAATAERALYLSVYTCTLDLWLRPFLPHAPAPQLVKPGGQTSLGIHISEVSSCVSHKLAPAKQLELEGSVLISAPGWKALPFPPSPPFHEDTWFPAGGPGWAEHSLG